MKSFIKAQSGQVASRVSAMHMVITGRSLENDVQDSSRTARNSRGMTLIMKYWKRVFVALYPIEALGIS